MKWLRAAVHGLHLVVPYLALAFSLAGAPECAALLQSAALPGVQAVPEPPVVIAPSGS